MRKCDFFFFAFFFGLDRPKQKQANKKKAQDKTQQNKNKTKVETNLIIKWTILTMTAVLTSLIPAIYAGVTEIDPLTFNAIVNCDTIINCMCLMFYSKRYNQIYHKICCVCHSFFESKLKQVIMEASPQMKSQTSNSNDLSIIGSATNQNTVTHQTNTKTNTNTKSQTPDHPDSQ